MSPAARNLLWAAACALAAIASAVWSAYSPMGYAPDYGPVNTEQPICNPDKPRPGCVPLQRLT